MKAPAFIAALTLAALAPLAQAITLAPGQTVVPTAISSAPAGTSNLSWGNVPYSFPGPNGFISRPGGRYFYNAVQDPTSLNITYTFEVQLNDPLSVDEFLVKGYQGISVDAGYLAGSEIVPTSVSRSDDGDSILFKFPGDPATPNPLNPTYFGHFYLILQTDAQTSSRESALIEFLAGPYPTRSGFQTDAPSPHAAAIPTPELSSLSLLTLATASLALRFRRRVSHSEF